MESPEQLFARYRRDRDPESLGALFDRCGPKLLALALHLCGHPADAEDALQATFVAAIDQADRWDGKRALLPWLSGILDRQCRRVHQRRQRRREQELPADELVLDEGSPVAASERGELVARLRQHIERLPFEQRQVLLLQLEHGLSPAEASEVLGVPPGTVRMRLHRGVMALRTMLPASLVALLLSALPARGVAAVKTAVMSHAATATATFGGLWLWLPKLLLAAAVLMLSLVGAFWFVVPNAPPAPVRDAPSPSVGVVVRGDQARVLPAPLQRDPVPAPTPASTPAAGSVRVRARIVGSEQPVPNMHVELAREGGDVDRRFASRVAGTDAAGEAVFADCEAGPCQVLIGGSQFERVVVVAGQETLVDCTLPAQRMEVVPCRCRVLLADGAPAAGARIVATSLYGRSFEFELGIADGDGRLAVAVPYRWLAIGARLPDLPPTNFASVDPQHDIVLQFPGSGLQVRGVILAADGEPARGAIVRFDLRHGADDLRLAPRPRLVVADESGRFLCTDLPALPLRAVVRAPSHAIGAFDIDGEAGGSRDVQWQLEVGRTMRGRIVDQHGRPVPAWIRVGDDLARQAAADGRFDFQQVDPRFRSLSLQADGHRNGDFVWPTDDETEVTIVLQRWPHYPLRLVDARQLPLAGYRARLEPYAESSRFTADSDGRVELWVTADAATSLAIGASGAIDATIRLPLPVGMVPEVECTVVVPDDALPSAVVSGQLSLPATTPMWVSVELRAPTGQYLARQEGELVSFRFEQVPAGDWELHVRRGGQTAAEPPRRIVGLAAGEHRDLGALVPLRTGRVVFRPQIQAKGASVHVFDRNDNELGSRRPGDGPMELPVGDYRWLWMAEDTDWPSGHVTVVAEQTTVVDVPLRAAVRRRLVFPVPTPAWGAPELAHCRLLAPDGQVADELDFDPRTELPFRYMPPLWPGPWRLELSLPDGQRFVGTFSVEVGSEAGPAIEIAVQPAR